MKKEIPYGEKRDYRKIDIFTYHPVLKVWQYEYSTTWSRTCKEAKTRTWLRDGLMPGMVRARFSKESSTAPKTGVKLRGYEF